MFTATNVRVGGLVRDFRLAAGLTQVELAKRVKVGQGMVSKVEKGQVALSLPDLKRWCDALGVTVEAFVKRIDSLPSEVRHEG